MAQIRVRIELQRPEQGIELAKLQRLALEAQKLLRMLADDVAVGDAQGKWTAKDFYNQGVGFDAEYELVDVDQVQADEYLAAIAQVATVGENEKFAVRGVSAATVVQAARLALVADQGETIRVGVPTVSDDGQPLIDWKPLHRVRADQIVAFFDQRIEYRGMLQGVIHSLYKESNPAYFDLRDLASGELVKCYYSPDHYTDVHRALEKKDGVVLVAGWIRARRLDKVIEHLDVQRIRATRPLDADELKAFFGSAPGWTGDLTSDQFIEKARGEADGDE